ncbi:flavin reductase family protein [Rhodospirillaceae bacterium SYSU D60014]|uniref:flavin reductase family protein n=1 Tax=Virgifigura deserti TaxID=2268457 RepID=UPI000E672417
MTVDRRAFRDALGCFATGVTVATSTTPKGELHGITANSFNSVSLNPPLVLFSMDRSAYSLKAFEESGCFAINILRDDQISLSSTFAQALADKWDGIAYEIWETGCPILTDALASFDCRTHSIHDGGDHLIFVGRVLRHRSQDEGQPLLYFRGTYHHIG